MAAGMSSSSALDQLQEMVRLVLIETGNVFSDPTKHHPRAVVQTNAHLKETLPKYWAAFHDALDFVEEDLMQARAVLRRDLRTLQADKRKPAIDAALPATDGAQVVKTDAEQLPTEPTGKAVPPSDGQDVGGDFDIIMSDEVIEVHPGVVKDSEIGKAATESTDMHDDNQRTVAKVTLSQNSVETSKEEGLNVQTDDVTQAAPKTITKSPAEATDKDLDSILEYNKTENSASADGKDSKADKPDQGISETVGDSSKDSGKSRTNETTNPESDSNFTNADVSSLLPGLESYANDNGEGDAFGGLVDFADFGNTSFDGNPDMQGTHSTTMIDDFMAGQGANKSFDELFDYGEFNHEGGSESHTFLDGTEFDDNFFNLDNVGN